MKASVAAVLLFSLAANTAHGAPPVLSIPVIDGITHASARLSWTTDLNATTCLDWGPTTTYGSSSCSAQLNAVRNHAWHIGGLPPAAITHARVRSRTAGGTGASCTGDEACSPDLVFTTLPRPTVHPALPTLPATFSTAMPAINGSIFTVAAGCTDLQAKINAASGGDGNLNHAVLIPAGAICHDQYTLPAKTGPNAGGPGVIIIRPTSPDNELPPEGTRVTPAFAPKMATIRTNMIAARMATTAPSTCNLGDFWWDTDATSFALSKATATGPCVWTPIPAAGSGTTVPPTCADGDWFYKTDTPLHDDRPWWCSPPSGYQQVTFHDGSPFAQYAAVRAAPNAKGYRLMGLIITHIKTPDSYEAQFDAAPSAQFGSRLMCLLDVPDSSADITVDRTHFKGQPHPSRVGLAMCSFQGRRNAIIDSHFSDIHNWVNAASVEYTPSAINMDRGPGPFKIVNNYFENCLGITVYQTNDLGTSATYSEDVEVSRNHFFTSDAFNFDSPVSNGRRYWRRHHLELKRGRRWLIDGNIFDGGWTVNQNGAAILMLGRPGVPFLATNDIAVADITIRNNIFRNTPEAIRAFGHSDGANLTGDVKTFERLLVENNLAQNLSDRRSGWGWFDGPTGVFLVTGAGMEDLTVRHNTVYRSEGVAFRASLMWTPGAQQPEKNEGLVVNDNILTTMGAASALAGVWLGSIAEGTAALNNMWTAGAAPSYAMRANAILRATAPANYPAGNFWPASEAMIGFTNAVAGDFRLAASSPYKGAATDGTDVGVDALKLPVMGGSGILGLQCSPTVYKSAGTGLCTVVQ